MKQVRNKGVARRALARKKTERDEGAKSLRKLERLGLIRIVPRAERAPKSHKTLS